MRTTFRLLVLVAAPLVTATPAFAWHCCRYPAAAPMMPMMGMGAMPMMPAMTMPMMPAMTMPMMAMPAMTAASGMSFSMSASGDMMTAMLLAGLLRNLGGAFLGVPGAANNAEAQAAALARQVVTGLISSGATMSSVQANDILTQLRTLNDQMNRALKDRGVMGGQPPPKSSESSSPKNGQAERARAEIRQMVAQAAARKPRQAVSAEQARAEIRQMVAAQRARTAAGAVSSAEKARAEIRQMVAAAAARRARGKAPAATTVARNAK